MNKVNLKYKLEMQLLCDFLSQYCFFLSVILVHKSIPWERNADCFVFLMTDICPVMHSQILVGLGGLRIFLFCN